MDAFTILWEDHASFLARTDRPVADDAFLPTGPERFQEYGLPLLATEARYYFYPADRVDLSPEELVPHTLLIDSGSRHRSYCLLLLSGEDVDEALLRRRGEHYGISDLVEQLLEYLDSRGASTAESLPS